MARPADYFSTLQNRPCIEDYLDHLCPIDYKAHIRDIVDETCDLSQWLTDTAVSKAWRYSKQHWQLHVNAVPGSGRTTIAAWVTKVLEDGAVAHNGAVFCVLLDEDSEALVDGYGASAESGKLSSWARLLLRALVRQTLESSQCQHVPQGLTEGSDLPFDDLALLGYLEGEMSARKWLYLIMDGMDHISEKQKKQMEELFTWLHEQGVKILTTDRQDYYEASDTVSCNHEGCDNAPGPHRLWWHCVSCRDGKEFDLCHPCVDDGRHCNCSNE